MVHGSSLCLISSSPASVCSLTSNDSNCPPPGNSDWPSSSSPSSSPFLSSRVLSILKRKNSGLSKLKLKVSSKQHQQQQLVIADDGSAEQFLQDNSIADFMRFIKRGSNSKSNDCGGEGGGGHGSSALQTAVVSYGKKFPWYLLQPFLQVDKLFYFYYQF